MKKFLTILLIMSTFWVLTACATEDIIEDVIVETTPTIVPDESDENSEAYDEIEEETDTQEDEDNDDTIIIDADSTYGGYFTAIEGDTDFINAFVGNSVDTDYIEQISLASSVSSMNTITSETAALWEREINYIYTLLMAATNNSETEAEEQTAWANDLPIVIAEITDSTADQGTSGTLDASTQIMEVYRNRAIDLYAKVFSYTGTVEFAPLEDEVVG